jgi:cytoskeletal protein RodZ
MPLAEELPECLRDLVHRHAVSMHHAQFATDAERLIRKIRAIKQTRRMRYSAYLIWAALIIAVVGTAIVIRSSYQQAEVVRQDAEAANREAATRQEAAKQEAAKQEAAKQEAAKQEAAKQEAAKQEAAKQEAAKQEAAKQEAAKQEAAKQEAAKQEAAKQEAAKQEAAKQDAAKQEAAKQQAPAVNQALQPTQAAGFEGRWESETQWAGCRLGSQTVILNIVSGVVSVDGKKPRNLSGTVTAQGKIKFQYDIRDETGTEWTNFFDGSISGNRGSGRAWSRYCSGTFALKRK